MLFNKIKDTKIPCFCFFAIFSDWGHTLFCFLKVPKKNSTAFTAISAIKSLNLKKSNYKAEICGMP